jgi:thiol-disulfide isomerase/thioredoxin
MRRTILVSAAVLSIAIVSISWISNPFAAKAPNIGEKAIDITLKTPQGKDMSLSEFEGNVVLLDFWASWCGPCRRKNPEIVKLYEQYKDEKFIKGTKGFEVFSVSLDKSQESWEAAIVKDSLNWPGHVSDLRGWSSAGGALYGVRSIPETYLIDEEGIIIGKNLSSAAIELELQKRIKK